MTYKEAIDEFISTGTCRCCGEKGPNGLMLIAAKCHGHPALAVYYAEGQLHLNCPECDRELMAVEVLSKELVAACTILVANGRPERNPRDPDAPRASDIDLAFNTLRKFGTHATSEHQPE